MVSSGATPEHFPSVADRSRRWSDEPREAVSELHDGGLPSELVVQAAALFDLLADFKDAPRPWKKYSML